MQKFEKKNLTAQLKKAKDFVKAGETASAIQLYQQILKEFPENKKAKHALKSLSKPIANSHVNNQLDELWCVYQEKQYNIAIKLANRLKKKLNRSSVLQNILGACYLNTSQIDKAIASFQRALELEPNNAEINNNLGTVFKIKGDYAQAKLFLKRAIILNPEYCQAYNNLGNSYKALNAHQKAIQCYQKALELSPDYLDAILNLGSSLYTIKKYTESIELYQKALKIFPNHAPTYAQIALVQKALGDYETAVYNFKKSLALQPNQFSVLNNLGNTQLLQGRYQEAKTSYQEANRLNPDSAEIINNLANAHKELNESELAIQYYKKALKIDPRFTQAYNNLGNTLKMMDKTELAIEYYRHGLKLNPADAEALNNIGNAYLETGQIELARKSYEAALKIEPTYPEALRHLGGLKKFRKNDQQIALMEQLLNKNNLSLDANVHLNFALAKAYEDIGDIQQSFKCLQRGNKFRKEQVNIDFSTHRARFRLLKKLFKQGQVDIKGNAAGFENNIKPIFVVGMPRSGTSLVEQILSSHSKVYGAGELNYLTELVQPFMAECSHNDEVCSDIASIKKHSLQIGKSYLKKLATHKIKEKIIIDKMPHNFLWIGFIVLAFQNAKIICLRREPVATCWSIYKHYFSEYGNSYAYDFDELAEFYLLFDDLISYWKQLFPDNIYEVNYERLTENQEQETRQVLSFCELGWEDECLDFHLAKRLVKTASAAQVRKKMYTGSSQAWKKYQTELQPLINRLNNVIT